MMGSKSEPINNSCMKRSSESRRLEGRKEGRTVPAN